MTFARYVALGDSMSIDLYPALDLGATDVAVALERVPDAGNVAPVGAASLLYHNDDEHWPDEIGNDLLSRFPGLEYQNLAHDGATIGDVFGEQLPLIDAPDVPSIVTLTIGTYDLFSSYANRPKRGLRQQIVHDIAEAFDFLVDAIHRTLPTSVLVLTTIYDPSDRSGRIPGLFDDDQQFPLDGLDALNTHIRQIGSGTPRTAVGEVYGEFLSHGTSAPDAERWYWRRSLTEPNARGANEIRRIWLHALEPFLDA